MRQEDRRWREILSLVLWGLQLKVWTIVALAIGYITLFSCTSSYTGIELLVEEASFLDHPVIALLPNAVKQNTLYTCLYEDGKFLMPLTVCSTVPGMNWHKFNNTSQTAWPLSQAGSSKEALSQPEDGQSDGSKFLQGRMFPAPPSHCTSAQRSEAKHSLHMLILDGCTTSWGAGGCDLEGYKSGEFSQKVQIGPSDYTRKYSGTCTWMIIGGGGKIGSEPMNYNTRKGGEGQCTTGG